MTEREALKLALEALVAAYQGKDKTGQVTEAITAIREALEQPEQRYRRGDRLVCLETDEFCVIHIAGTDRQWVKFPDTHIGVYTNEQVDQLFEKLARETDMAQPEPEPVACPFPCGWKRLFEIIIADGAFLVRSLEEDEVITAHQREVVMRLISYAKDMALHGMKATLPQRKPLTDEQWQVMADTLCCLITRTQKDAIEAVIGIKE